MNILFIVSNLSYPPSEGAHAQTFTLIKELLSKGNKVTLKGYIKASSNFDFKKLQNDIPDLIIGQIENYKSNYIALALKNSIKMTRCEFAANGADIIHFEGFGVLPLVSIYVKTSSALLMSLIDPWALRQQKRMRSSLGFFKKISFFIAWQISKYLEALFLPKFDCVHLVSSQDVLKVTNDYPTAKFSSIPLAFEVHDFLKSKYTYEKRLKLLFWGDLNVDYLAKGLQLIVGDVIGNCEDEIELIVLGRMNKEDYIAKYSLKNEHYKDVKFIDWIDNLNEFITMNDLVILPDQDGTGLKNRMISAMMLGMPVIASTAAVEGIVGADGKDFMLCRTSLDFINALNTLSADTSNRESLGQNASKISNQSYNTDAVMKNWLLTYKRIIHEK